MSSGAHQGMTSHQGASELLLMDILTELRQMKMSVEASEVKLRFLERGEKSFLLHMEVQNYKNKRERETERERERERERD